MAETRTIWKYQLGLSGLQSIWMPADAKILCVHTQGDVLMLWAMVDPVATKKPRRIAIIATGQPYPFDGREQYIGTVQQADGNLIWHMFEVFDK